jgi:spermidine/putrescine-binding protein
MGWERDLREIVRRRSEKPKKEGWKMSMKKRAMDRREFLKYAGYAATIGGGVLLGGGIPPSETASAKAKFTLARVGGSWGDGLVKVFVEGSGFRRKWDVAVEYAVQIDSVSVSKGIINKENPIFDVFNSYNTDAAKLYSAGAIDTDLDLSGLSNYGDIPSQAKVGKYFAGFLYLNIGLCYNAKYVKRPESYRDMWNPKYKGRVGIPAYGWNGRYWLHAINKFLGGTEDNTMPAIEALGDLMKKQKPLVPDTVDLVKKLFHAGELWIMPFWDGRTRQLIEEGAPVDFFWPKDYLALFHGMAIMNNTEVPEICMDFVNGTLDPRNQVEFVKIFKYSPTNRKCELPRELEGVKVPEKELEKAADIDWVKVVNNLEKNLELWNKHVLGA